MGKVEHLDNYRNTAYPYINSEYLEVHCTNEGIFEIGDSFDLDGVTWEIAVIDGRTAYAKIAATQY